LITEIMIVATKGIIIAGLTIFSLVSGMRSVNSWPYGTWRIYKYKIGLDPTGFTLREVQSLIGKTIVLRVNRAIMLKDTCDSPNYVNHWVKAEYIEENLGIHQNFLNLHGDSINVLSLKCNTRPRYHSDKSVFFSNDFVIISSSEMVFEINGDFFYIRKIN
jgi:hypothetical protein